MSQPVVHFEVQGKDGKKLEGFYANLFDWKIDTSNPMNYGAIESSGEGGIGGGIAQADAPLVTFYVQVDDPQAYLNKAESLGGKTMMPVTELPVGVTIASFADPEGNVIGLVKEWQRGA